MSETRWIIEREGQSIILVTEELARRRARKARATLPRELVRLVCQNLAAVTEVCEAVMLRSEKEIETSVQRAAAVWLKSGPIKRLTGRRRCVVFFAPPSELLYADEDWGGQWPSDFLLIAPGDMQQLSSALNRFALKDYVEYYDAVCRLSLATVALYDNAELVINAPSDEWLATAVNGVESIPGCVEGQEIVRRLIYDVSGPAEDWSDTQEESGQDDIAKRVAQLFSDPGFTSHPAEPPKAWQDLLVGEDEDPAPAEKIEETEKPSEEPGAALQSEPIPEEIPEEVQEEPVPPEIIPNKEPTVEDIVAEGLKKPSQIWFDLSEDEPEGEE